MVKGLDKLNDQFSAYGFSRIEEKKESISEKISNAFTRGLNAVSASISSFFEKRSETQFPKTNDISDSIYKEYKAYQDNKGPSLANRATLFFGNLKDGLHELLFKKEEKSISLIQKQMRDDPAKNYGIDHYESSVISTDVAYDEVSSEFTFESGEDVTSQILREDAAATRLERAQRSKTAKQNLGFFDFLRSEAKLINNYVDSKIHGIEPKKSEDLIVDDYRDKYPSRLE